MFRQFVVVSPWRLSRKTFRIEQIVLTRATLSYINLPVPMSSILTRMVQGARLLEDLSCVVMVIEGNSGPISWPSIKPMRLIEDVLRMMVARSPGVRVGT